MKYLGLEFYKLKRKKIILMTFLFVAVEIMWCIINSNRAISRNPDMLGGFEYSYMLMSFASLNGLFFPILISIITSRISDIEHKGDTWKLLKSSVASLNGIYLSKFLCSAILVSVPVLIQVLSIVLFGYFRGVIESLSVFL
ncbi:TPA: ABC transporter permease, partial [Clostridioides difficile]|nr:ABC transporter permease [Clostridioides difficile]